MKNDLQFIVAYVHLVIRIRCSNALGTGNQRSSFFCVQWLRVRNASRSQLPPKKTVEKEKGYKARLLTECNSQKYGKDYDEMMIHCTIRLFLSVTSQQMSIKHLDVCHDCFSAWQDIFSP